MEWCQNHYLDSRFYTGSEFSSSPHQDSSFDLIYAISVLTHLDEAHQHQWPDEWRRIVRPGGIVIATFRGEDYLDSVIGSPDRRQAIHEDLERTGISFMARPGWTGVFDKFYGGT